VTSLHPDVSPDLGLIDPFAIAVIEEFTAERVAS
jgi:hypothetical protein